MGYDLRKVLIIDDSPESFQQNYGNAIRVPEYKGSVEDTVLLDLLEELGSVEDIREVEKRDWRHRSR